MKIKIFHLKLVLCTMLLSCQYSHASKLIYADCFDDDLSDWLQEIEQPASSAVKIINGKLDLSASGGATIWFKNKLSGNIIISYTVTVVSEGGVNDRVSDMNTFWMATDPTNININTRDGKFTSYDNLNLYYAGIGGHNNTVTRFRKYNSNGEKPVINEFTDKEHLLSGNQNYEIKIILKDALVQYFINNVLFWEYLDAYPLKEGYFGFRTYKSHQKFDNFKVYKIQ